MSVGSICYATSRGLGHLCKAFKGHGLIDDVMVVEHGRVPTNWDWYPGAPTVTLAHASGGQSQAKTRMYDFCKQHRAMVFFETPFHWPMIDFCRTAGIKTFLVTMYECTPRAHPRPDVYCCPSLLDLEYFSEWERGNTHYSQVRPFDRYGRAVFTPLPVAPGRPWRLRAKEAEHFIHNGGYLGVRFREGTLTLIDAMKHVKSPLRLTIRVQENVPPPYQEACAKDRRIEYIAETVPYDELYREGDVAVGAQKWNGCSLPLQEAFASGLVVCNTDRFPMNTWLPRAPLVAPESYVENSSIGGPYMRFAEAVVNPKDLAATIDSLYGTDLSGFSKLGEKYAADNSWAALGPQWKRLLQS